MTVGRETARLAAELQNAELVTAMFTGVQGELAQLRTEAGETVLASKATPEWPVAGDTVWCLTVGQQRVMLGSPGGSNWGVISAVGTGNAVVEYPVGSGQLATYLLPRDATALIGDRVLLDRTRALILAAWPPEAEPTPPPAPPAPDRGTTEREAEVHAAWDGTGQPNGFWLNGSLIYTRNRNGGPNYATVGYGGRIAQLGIDADSIISASVYLSLDKVGSQHTGGTHTLSGRSGVPAPLHTFDVKPATGWLTLPLEAVRAIARGDAEGLTFYGGAGTVLRGIQQSPGNLRLRLRYRVEA